MGRAGLAEVDANYFMAFHTILKTSKDYYSAMTAARTIAANITDMINTKLHRINSNVSVEVFPYRSVMLSHFTPLQLSTKC